MSNRVLPLICDFHSFCPSIGSSAVLKCLMNAFSGLTNDRGLDRFLAVSGSNVSS